MIRKLHRLFLPSVHVSNRAKLPSKPGCYYVFRGLELLYVGRAETSIKSRWNDHHKLPKLRNSDRIHYWTMPAVFVRDKEAVDINRFNPPLNHRREPRVWRGQLAGLVLDLTCWMVLVVLAWLIWITLR
jgi:hypothetical protein